MSKPMQVNASNAIEMGNGGRVRSVMMGMRLMGMDATQRAELRKVQDGIAMLGLK